MTTRKIGRNNTMSNIATIHVGSIDNEGTRLFTTFDGFRYNVLYDLNLWIFKQLRDIGADKFQLPPLDEWTRIKAEDNSWKYLISSQQWLITISEDIINLP